MDASIQLCVCGTQLLVFYEVYEVGGVLDERW